MQRGLKCRQNSCETSVKEIIFNTAAGFHLLSLLKMWVMLYKHFLQRLSWFWEHLFLGKSLNPNLGELFRGSFWGRGLGKGDKINPSLKLVRIMLETWIYPLVFFSPLNIFFLQKNQPFFGKNSTFTQSNSVRAVLDIF